jgi:hypothetical protein
MMKTGYFDTYDGPGWPESKWLERYFVTARGQRDFFAEGNDSWLLTAQGVEGTADLPARKGRLDVELHVIGHPDLGVILLWRKTGRAPAEAFYSKGDVSRLLQWVKDMNGYLKPVGLFISFEAGWPAVNEFLQRNGALPKSIEWIASSELPQGVFPSQ